MALLSSQYLVRRTFSLYYFFVFWGVTIFQLSRIRRNSLHNGVVCLCDESCFVLSSTMGLFTRHSTSYLCGLPYSLLKPKTLLAIKEASTEDKKYNPEVPSYSSRSTMSTTLSDFFREPRSLSIASRRRTQCLRLLNQGIMRTSGYEPFPAPGLPADPSTRPSLASGNGNFSFQAPTGRIVGFPRLFLLSRAIEFTLPPSYDSLEAAKSLPSPPASPQPRDRGRSFAATDGRDTHNRLVVHVRDISPVAS